MAKNIYNLRDYADFSEADAAKKKKESAESSVANYGDFQYGRQDAYDKAIDAIINTKPFEYNLNTDALYDRYKNQYQALGKLAMQDTMGQAAAMTGGYGNSYAATAGNQAYQSYLSQLNDVIPQLYQMALDRYNTERDVANSTMSALSADRSTQYGEWNDRYNRLLTERDYAGNEYNNALNLAHQLARNAIADEQDLRDFNYQKARDAVADSQWQKTYDRGVYEYDTNLAYQKEQDQKANSLAWANYNLNKTKSDQSAYIESLESQLEDNTIDYSALKNVKNEIVSREDFEKYKSNVSGTGKTLSYRYNGKNYSSYESYVKDVLQTHYEKYGTINRGTLDQLLEDYKITS